MLRSYITRFNKEALSIDEVDDKILVATFTNGLWKGKFLFSLFKNDPKTMLDVLYRATKYMNVEDALLALKEKPKKMHDRIGDKRRLELETVGRIVTPNPPLEGSPTSPHLLPRLIKY